MPITNEDFVERLNIAFEYDTMAEVARRLGIPHATVRNYYQGRLPAPEVLIKMGRATGVSLNWLLSGKGDKYAGQIGPMELGKFIEEKIGEMIDDALDKKLAERGLATPHWAEPEAEAEAEAVAVDEQSPPPAPARPVDPYGDDE